MYKRIAADIIFVGAVLFAPWWAVGIFGAVLLFVFPAFIEFIVAGVLLDLLYGTGELYFTIGALAVYVATFFLKKAIRYYN